MVADARCDTYCKHAGYDSGVSKKKSCFCFDQLDLERASEKRIVIPRRAANPQTKNQESDFKSDLSSLKQFTSD